MNKPVSFELAKLLKEKGYSWECENFYKKGKYNKKFYLSTGVEYDSDRNCIWDWNLNGGKSGMLSKVIPYPNEGTAIYYSAPTIAEVVMWLYEKHGLFIHLSYVCWSHLNKHAFTPHIAKILSNNGLSDAVRIMLGNENSPTEAYEAAILYTLNNLI